MSRHAGRSEGLHEGQDLLDVLHGGLAARGDLAHLGPQIAVLVQVADDLVTDAADRRVLDSEAKLLVEVVGERGLRPHHVLEGQLVAVLLGHQRALFVVVEHDRGEIERQVVGAPLAVHRGRLQRLRFRGGGRRRRRGLAGRGCLGRLRRLGRHLFQQRVLEQLLLDHFLELERGQLQQLDRLLQQRGHDDPLALS